MSVILGINAYHGDSSAALVRDGRLVAAVEEERFRRIKHWGGFPSESIRYCLKEAGISLADVSHVAVNSDNSANRWRKLAYVLTAGISPSYVKGSETAVKMGSSRMAKAEERAGLGLPSAEDIAPITVFLCGPGAEKVTGQVISVNGGLNA